MMIVLFAFCWIWPVMYPVESKIPLSPPGQYAVVYQDSLDSTEWH